jgi:GNAT superfamily N-acetyltransferase
VYAAREAAGELMVITLRDKGRLVGYFVGIVAPGLHYSTCLTLTMDIFWTHPDIRGGFAGVKLFRAVEKEAKRRGVQRMFYGSKLHKDCGSLFRYLGLEPIETYYSKWIGA